MLKRMQFTCKRPRQRDNLVDGPHPSTRGFAPMSSSTFHASAAGGDASRKIRRRRQRMYRSCSVMAEALENRVLLATVATITNALPGDGALLLTVDAYGSFGAAYDNISDPTTIASDTVYDP